MVVHYAVIDQFDITFVFVTIKQVYKNLFIRRVFQDSILIVSSVVDVIIAIRLEISFCPRHIQIYQVDVKFRLNGSDLGQTLNNLEIAMVRI